MLQLRLTDESARTLVEVARALRVAAPEVPLIVNCRADVALASGAQGVHVGVDDLSPNALRRIVPADFLIGASVGTELEIGRAVGADYVGIGPVYSTGSAFESGVAIGPAGFSSLAARCRVPAVAIGGITVENAPDVMAAGASGVAVISAVFGADDPMPRARALRSALDASGR